MDLTRRALATQVLFHVIQWSVEQEHGRTLILPIHLQDSSSKGADEHCLLEECHLQADKVRQRQHEHDQIRDDVEHARDQIRRDLVTTRTCSLAPGMGEWPAYEDRRESDSDHPEDDDHACGLGHEHEGSRLKDGDVEKQDR